MTDRPTVKMGVKQCYNLILSSGPAIAFDPDELPAVRSAIENGIICQLRRGFFNPSFFVSIVQDEKRYVEFLENTKYSDTRSIEARSRGMKPLADIFADNNTLALASPETG